MRIQPAQLVPGCVLLEDVKGKTGRPIVPQNTVLTEEHILVLQKFLIKEVRVASKLAEGDKFTPLPAKKERVSAHLQHIQPEEQSLSEHYQHVVSGYKRLYSEWENGVHLDIAAVRKLFVPFIMRAADADLEVMALIYQKTDPEEYLYYHSTAVGILSAFLAKKAGYEKGKWIQTGLAGFLSDAGMAKMGGSASSSGNLAEDQRQKIKKHPIFSYRLLEHIQAVTASVKLAVLQHHERLDGSGYPLGLQEDKISQFARIIAICDTYQTATYEQTPFEALGTLKNSVAEKKLDPKLTEILTSNLLQYL